MNPSRSFEDWARAIASFERVFTLAIDVDTTDGYSPELARSLPSSTGALLAPHDDRTSTRGQRRLGDTWTMWDDFHYWKLGRGRRHGRRALLGRRIARSSAGGSSGAERDGSFRLRAVGNRNALPRVRLRGRAPDLAALPKRLTDPSVRPRTSLVWKRPQNVARAEELKGFGGVACPLLAGFSLAATTTLLTAATAPPLAEYAVAAFACSAVLLLFALQFAFLAVRHSASPSERLSWHPEAAMDVHALNRERLDQAEDKALADAYYRRTAACYNTGLFGFFAALALLLFPTEWEVANTMGFTLVVVGAGIELYTFILARLLRWPIRWLLPQRADVPATISELDDVSLAAVTKQGSP